MQSLLSKSWDNFYVDNPDGGPWDKVVKPDEHIIDFVQNYQFKKGVTALDSGWADGRNTKYLVEAGFQVTGIDISTTVINRVKDKVPSGKFLAADAKKLPFANSCFDVICDAGALHVNAPGDVSLILKEYQRVLSKKGVLFIRVFNKTLNDSDLPIFFCGQSQ